MVTRCSEGAIREPAVLARPGPAVSTRAGHRAMSDAGGGDLRIRFIPPTGASHPRHGRGKCGWSPAPAPAPGWRPGGRRQGEGCAQVDRPGRCHRDRGRSPGRGGPGRHRELGEHERESGSQRPYAFGRARSPAGGARTRRAISGPRLGGLPHRCGVHRRRRRRWCPGEPDRRAIVVSSGRSHAAVPLRCRLLGCSTLHRRRRCRHRSRHRRRGIEMGCREDGCRPAPVVGGLRRIRTLLRGGRR